MIEVYLYEIPKNTVLQNNFFINRFCTKEELQKPSLFPETKHLTSLYGKAIAKFIAAQKTKVDGREVVIKKTTEGKPYFVNIRNLHFNISHCENMVAVAFCDKEIGVDIEKIRSADLNIAKRFFTPQEYDYVLNHHYKNKAFFEVWTAKEAYLKRVGTGINSDFSKISVKSNSVSEKITTTEQNEFIISLCCENPKGISFIPFNPDNLSF